MRKLLDLSTQRLIRLLEVLASQEDWMTTGELSSLIGASERTISEDVDTLNQRWGQYLDIEITTKKGIRIRNQNASVLGRILVDLFNESTALRFLEEILLFPHHGTEYYEEKLFVSRSTLTRLLPRLNKYLSQRGISILRKNNSYQLIAKDEQHLRDFFAGFLIELNGVDLSKFNLNFDFIVPQTIAKRIFARCLDETEYAFAAKDELTNLFNGMFYFVSLLRENQGYTLFSDYSIEGEISDAEFSYFQNHFSNISADNLRPIHQFIHDQLHGWTSEEERALVQRETAVFLDNILSTVQPLPGEDVIRRLNLVLRVMYFTAKHRPYQTSELFDRVRYFALSVKKCNEPFYRLVERNLASLSQRIGFDMSGRLKDILFWMFLAFPRFGDFSAQKTALVVSDFGSRHAGFLAEYISMFFYSMGKSSALKAIPVPLTSDAQLFDAKDCDFVISTVPTVAAGNKKVILVNDFPTRENMCEIYKTLTL
ncbi:MAG: helix-turn-helix domain-containing protein [Christensenellales bacterium]